MSSLQNKIILVLVMALALGGTGFFLVKDFYYHKKLLDQTKISDELGIPKLKKLYQNDFPKKYSQDLKNKEKNLNKSLELLDRLQSTTTATNTLSTSVEETLNQLERNLKSSSTTSTYNIK